jgi:hypothetical protein
MSFLTHITGGKSKQPDPEPVGPFIWVDEEGTSIEYDYDDRVIMKRGDERVDGDGAIYFVPLDLLPEFDYHDETIEDNEKFWDWMEEFVKRNGLTSSRKQRQRSHVQAQDFGFGEQKTKKYLSDWWGGSSFYGGDLEDAKRYAIALQAVRSTVRVVDSHSRRLAVELVDTDMQERIANGDESFQPTSVTNFGERKIYVSGCALTDKTMEQGEAIDITTGFALHEASHGEYTEDIFPALEQPTRLKPLAVAGHLMNIVEDTRIESLTSEQFPGFAGYFEKTNEYMWGFMDQHAPPTWGPELNDKLNAVCASVKWPEQYRDRARQDPILSDEFDWWNDWRDRYLAGGRPRALLVEAMQRLEEDPQTKKEMEEQSQKETQAGLDGEKLQKALEEALKQLQEKGQLIKPCSSVTHGDADEHLKANVDPQTNQRTKQMSEQELQEDPVIKQQFPNGPGAPTDIVSWRPTEDDYSRDKYVPPNQGLVQRMKSSFAMRPSAMEWTDRLQKSGAVDEDEIWRAGAGDLRFFEKKTVESTPDTKIALLVDCSGSMNGRKLRSATDVASIIHACTKDMNGVDVMVYGHTGDNGIPGEGNAGVFRVWERGEPVSRLGTLMTQEKGDNYDGYALGWVTQELLKRSTPEEQKLLFIMSDGLPNGWGGAGRWGSAGYGGFDAMNHIRSVVRWAEGQGVDIVQIAIDPSMRPDEQAQMYKHWVAFETLEQLPVQVMNILKKLL